MTHSPLLSRRAFAASALASAALATTRGATAATLAPTPAQIMGPFYPVQRLADEDADLTWIKGRRNRAAGNVVQVTGRVLDRMGNPVRNARLELWQCNAFGRYAHPADPATQPLDPDFQGYASLATGSKGEWRVTTIKPAGYDSPVGKRTPHIHFIVRGSTQRLVTQMYFSDDEASNSRDALYRRLGGAAGLTVARLDAPGRYAWDIVLT